MKNMHKLVLCAIFAAICYVTTMVIAVPSFYTRGYVNLGDVSVLITSYIVGGGYGAFAAGFGSALADASLSYYQYVPVTFVIKALMCIISSFFFRRADKSKLPRLQAIHIGAGVLLAEIFMASGYFLYELVIYKKGAFASLPGNGIQACVCAVVAIVGIIFLKRNTFIKKIKNTLK